MSMTKPSQSMNTGTPRSLAKSFAMYWPSPPIGSPPVRIANSGLKFAPSLNRKLLAIGAPRGAVTTAMAMLPATNATAATTFLMSKLSMISFLCLYAEVRASAISSLTCFVLSSSCASAACACAASSGKS